MIFDSWSSTWIWNPFERVNNFNCWTNCRKVEVSTCLYANSYLIYVFISEIINLIKSHFLSVELPYTISIFRTFCISCSSSCPFCFWSIRISNSHFHAERLKYSSYIDFILVTIWRKENLLVLSLLLSYLLNRIISYKIFLFYLL